MEDQGRRSIGAQRNLESERAILDAAHQLLSEKGLAGFSIEAVARLARAGKPTIYRWWPDKARLLLAVYARIKDGLQDPKSETLEGTVEGFLKSVLDFWRNTDAGVLFRSVIAQSQSDPEARDALTQYHEGRLRHTAELFSQSFGGRCLPPATAAHLAEAAASVVLTRLMMNRLEVEESELTDLASLLVRGSAAQRQQ